MCAAKRKSKPGKVELAVEQVTIPTYAIPEADRNPMLFERESNNIYPYSLRDDLVLDRDDGRQYTAVRLENEFTEVTVLPELGGHIWGAYDKAGDHEIFYRNHAVKPGLILLSGAWIPTGVEFNFPQGHNVTTVSPVDWHTRRNPDGSASVVVGDIEQVQRMRWQVEIRLVPGCSYIETQTTLENRTHLPQRYYYWANAAYPATPNLQYVTDADWITSWTGAKSFPVDEHGVDISYYKNHQRSNDMFSIGDDQDFFGAYDHDAERGLCHVADATRLPSKKFFTWGRSEGGLVWASMLTDHDGPYVEYQAGIFPTQGDFGWLQPGQVVRLKELWYSVNGTGGFRYANSNVLMNYEVKRGSKPGIDILLNSTSTLRKARVVVEDSKGVLISRTCGIVPGKPTRVAGKTSRRPGPDSEISISVYGDDGLRIAYYAPDAKDEVPPPSPLGWPGSAPEGASEGEMVIAAGRLMSHKSYSSAEKMLERLLDRDPGSCIGLCLKAYLRMLSGLYGEAAALARKALDRDPANAQANYYEAVSSRRLGHRHRARVGLQVAAKASSWQQAAEIELAEMAIGEERPSRAIELLDRVKSGGGAPARACALLAMAYRRACNPDRAADELDRLSDVDPIEYLVHAERYLLARGSGKKEARKKALDRMREVLRDSVQAYLEIVCEYMRLGFLGDALEFARLAVRSGGRRGGAMPRYYAAYLLGKLGKRSQAKKELAAADKASLERQFPHRLEEETVLKWAIETRKSDGRACYLLGNLLAARRREEEAADLWRRGAKSMPEFSVVHRNLGHYYWVIAGDRKAAARCYRKAIAAAPGDHKLYGETDRLLCELGRDAERLRLGHSVMDGVVEHFEAAERLAVMLVDVGRYGEALKFMETHVFKPWEGGSVMHYCYVDARIGLARKELARGNVEAAEEHLLSATDFPENLHIGRPKRLSSPEACYMLGGLAEERGDRRAARKYWEMAGQVKVRFVSKATYYQALSLVKLGKKAKSKAVLKHLLENARHAFLGLSRSTKAQRPFLEGLAHYGNGDLKSARKWWKAALARDAGHRDARHFMAEAR